MPNKKPIDKVQSGPVTGAIWENETKEGGTFFNATFERVYKDGEEFKNTGSYGANDLPHLAMCAQKASFAIDALLKSRKQGDSR
jgi:hypothetical protein